MAVENLSDDDGYLIKHTCSKKKKTFYVGGFYEDYDNDEDDTETISYTRCKHCRELLYQANPKLVL